MHFHFVALEIIELFPYGSLQRRSKEEMWEELQRRPDKRHALSQPPAPFSMLYASFRLKATNDSAQFLSHITRHLDFLLQTSDCIKQYSTWTGSLSGTEKGEARLHWIHWCKRIGLFLRTPPSWCGRLRRQRLSGLGWKARNNPWFFSVALLYDTAWPDFPSLTLRAGMLQIMSRITCRKIEE